jgi:hypothetical protein
MKQGCDEHIVSSHNRPLVNSYRKKVCRDMSPPRASGHDILTANSKGNSHKTLPHPECEHRDDRDIMS